MSPSAAPRFRLRLAVLALALALAGAAAGCALQVGDEPTGQVSQASVCATGTVVKGIDVSSYQGTVNWTSVKAAGIDFAIARISDGSDLDSEFATNWSAMKSAGLVRGAYQYFEPAQDPTTQANIVISAVGMLGSGDLPVTADMEVAGGEPAATVVSRLQTWMAAVEAGTGKAPMIYTAEGFWDASVASTAFASNPLWVANWGVTCPTLPTGWSNWDFWQDSATGSISGISGAVDTDEFNGTLAQLQTFAGGGGTVSDGGTAGIYAATYVSQSWPLASTTWMMTTCETTASSITFKNTGTKTWDSNTRLATTQPRDRTSAFADSTWISVDRAAAVTGTVAPGDTYEFKFDFHAPPTAGTYTEYFGLVEDGVAWFGDPGQGGPPDNDVEANIQVTAGTGTCTVDPGVPDGGSTGGTGPGDGGSATGEGGSPAGDGGAQSGGDAGPTATDASGPGEDSGAAFAPGGNGNSGCGCDAVGAGGAGGAPVGSALGLALALGAVARRRRR